MDEIRIGIDLGGSKIEIAALDSRGNERRRQRTPSPQGSYDATVQVVASLIAGFDAGFLVAAPVGIGIPGTISPATGLVKNANSTWLIGRPLDRDLEQAIGRPVRIANDANCFALSEATDGAAAGVPVVFGVIIGTGTGGGVVVNGQILTGPNAIAGEWGHNPLPWPRMEVPFGGSAELPGPPCYCGKSGCIETFLSGPGLSRDFAAQSGRSLDPAAIAAAAVDGDPGAEASLCRYENRLARSLSSVINVLDPDVIVLGGGLSNLRRLYDSVPRLWRAHAFSDEITTRLVPARHGDASGVRGAARLWPFESA
jgi:fructokinase